MNSYQYKDDTKEYTGIILECNLNPIATKRTGTPVYFVPGNSTLIEPLTKKTNKAVIFNIDEQIWEYIQDYRGKRAYNDEGLIIINYLGKLQGSDKLLTKKQIEGIDNGSLIWKDGEIIENPGPSIEEQIQLLEQQIEVLNSKMLRDIIILQDENASSSDKEEAQRYFNIKLQQKQDLVNQINELKNT